MGRAKAALLTLVSAIFVAAGVFILARGEAGNVTLAWPIIAFFGACGLVGLLQFTQRRKVIPASSTELVLQPNRLHLVGMAIGSLAMAVGCFLMAPVAKADGEGIVSAVGYIGAAFFGIGAPLILWRALRLQPLARLSAEGVQTFGVGGWTLKWEDVRNIGVQHVYGQRFIVFDARTRPSLMPPLGYAISTSGSGFDFDDVFTFASELWTRNRGAHA